MRRSTRGMLGLALVSSLAAWGLPALAADQLPAGDPTTMQPRPEIIAADVRAEVASTRAGEPVEYLVSLDAAPDLDAIAFDRDAVVTALRTTAEQSQAPVVAHLQSQGAEVLNTFWLANVVAVRSSAEVMRGVTAIPAVTAIEPMGELAVPEPEVDPAGGVSTQTVEDRTWGIDRIGAHRVWGELGVDGSGVRVAVLDTGVDITHPDLAGRMATDDPADPTFPGGWMEFNFFGQPVASEPHDSQFHGTHVSGTALGGDNFRDGTSIGVAPGAQLMGGLVLPNGSGTNPQVIAAMQWTIDPFDQHGDPAGEPADVVNMSFGPRNGGIVDVQVEAIRNMYFAGVLPVASSGNCRDGCHGSPGNVFESFAVGSTDLNDDVATTSSGSVVQKSEWADPPADWPDSWVVPDVSAPGVDVISSVPPGTFPEEPEAIYGRSSGTSMASPHTAGTAALMLSADADLSLAEIAGTLIDMSFFDDRYGEARPNTRFGHGRIDAYRSVSQVVLDSGVTGQVTDVATDQPVPDVTVTAVETGVARTTGPDGSYDLRLPPGSYTLQLTWSGQVVATVSDVAVGEDALTSVDVALTGAAGQVVDADSGDPIADAEITVVATGVTVRTDDQGGYRLYLAPGAHPLRFSAFGYDDATRPDVEVVEDEFRTVDVALDPLPTGTVSGTVTLATSGDGVPGVPVTLPDTPLAAVTTGADGSYLIAGVPVGVYSVAAQPAGFPRPASQEIEVGSGGATADFTLDCGERCRPEQAWLAEYDGTGNTSVANDAVLSPDGAVVYVTGLSWGPAGTTVEDFGTVAFDAASGEQLWAAHFDGPVSGRDIAKAIDISPDGSAVYVTGQSLGDGTNHDYATAAYDAATGDELWVMRYNGPGDAVDIAEDVVVSPAGTVFVTGRSAGDGTGTDFATIAYHAATGDELWITRYDGNGRLAQARVVRASSDGTRVYVTGIDSSASGYTIAAYHAATGDQLWMSHYDGPGIGTDQPWALTVSPDDAAVYVTGQSRNASRDLDYATIALDASTGEQLWVSRYAGPGNGRDAAQAVAASPDGSAVYVTGGSAGQGADYATVGYDSATGDELWVARYDGSGHGDGANDLAVAPDGTTVYVTGTSARGDDLATTDYLTTAYDAGTGDELWVARHNGHEDQRDFANAVAVSPDGSSVYVTGQSGGIPAVSNPVYGTVAYDADIGDGFAVFVPWDLRIESGVALAGQPAEVSVTVTNVGTAAGDYQAVLLVDGAEEATTAVELEPGAATEISWPVARDEPGRYEVQVEHLTGELRVLGCDTTITGTHTGPLAVAGGVTCLSDGSRATGPVTVGPEAGLVAIGATVTGPVSATGAEQVELHGSRFTGAITVAGSTGSVVLAGNQITGVVRLTSNTTGPTPIVVSGNEITGSLSCSGNQPPPVDNGIPNTVTGRSSGQCTGL